MISNTDDMTMNLFFLVWTLGILYMYITKAILEAIICIIAVFILSERNYFVFSPITCFLSTALAKHHANGDTSLVTEIVNLCPIM